MDAFVSELRDQYGIDLKALVRNDDNEGVYEAELRNQSRFPCLVKAQWGCHQSAFWAEKVALGSLQHANIIGHYQPFSFFSQGWECFVLVTESLQVTLATEIANRRRNAHPWTEEEFQKAVYQLVSAFDYMESCQYAHFCISPEAIFVVGREKSLKVGHFEAAMMVPFTGVHSLVGKYPFFSPILKSAYRNGQSEVRHNIYKSGVYALGVTLVGMSIQESSPQEPSEGWQYFVWRLQWPDWIKGLLAWMLTEDEGSRPSFKEIRTWLGLPPSEFYSPPPIPSFPRLSQVTIPPSIHPVQADADSEDQTVDRFKPKPPANHQEMDEIDMQWARDYHEEAKSHQAEYGSEQDPMEGKMQRRGGRCSLF